MELAIQFSLYFIAIFCVFTPILAFGVFAPGIASSTVIGFIANWVGQYSDLFKDGKIAEHSFSKYLKKLDN